ncbi:uncharacterized protein ARMOST_14453 [Armillaria ostoyae]|uniref:Uncharacterized protein n=1 Tax=Armillaria ostoyae TaxID=47428 RepID=A0A284RQJ8_ARMOS|nr:uncharacterized protein ARMOST_14453 [Armillaria ostoyae]
MFLRLSSIEASLYSIDDDFSPPSLPAARDNKFFRPSPSNHDLSATTVYAGLLNGIAMDRARPRGDGGKNKKTWKAGDGGRFVDRRTSDGPMSSSPQTTTAQHR